jgi:hypothetical protein
MNTYDFLAAFTLAFVGDAVAAETIDPTLLTDTPRAAAILLSRYAWTAAPVTAVWTTAGGCWVVMVANTRNE